VTGSPICSTVRQTPVTTHGSVGGAAAAAAAAAAGGGEGAVEQR
jgi:hypothetical protein